LGTALAPKGSFPACTISVGSPVASSSALAWAVEWVGKREHPRLQVPGGPARHCEPALASAGDRRQPADSKRGPQFPPTVSRIGGPDKLGYDNAIRLFDERDRDAPSWQRFPSACRSGGLDAGAVRADRQDGRGFPCRVPGDACFAGPTSA